MKIPHYNNVRQYEHHIAMLQSKLNEAINGLKEYGDHKSNCALNAPKEDFGHLLCTCGLAKIIKDCEELKDSG